MAFDTSRLYSTLLTSRLQQDNPALYQVIFQLIGALSSLAVTVNGIGGINSDDDVVNIINNYQIVQGSRESSDGGGSRVIPGPPGINGTNGINGASLPGPLGIIKHYVETYPRYVPVPGNTGQQGTTGAQGPIGPVITSRYEEYVRQNIQLFQTISGGSGGAGSYVYLATRTASASATLDFTSLISSTYNKYIFEFENILPASDNVDFLMRTSTDNGSSYDSDASDYQYGNFLNNVGAFSTASVSSNAASSIKVMPTMDNGSTTGGLNGTLSLYNPLNAAQYKSVQYHVNAFLNDGQFYNEVGSGYRVATADIDAVRFLYSSGNIASGVIRMYGVKTS